MTQKGQAQVLILAGIVLFIVVAGGIFYLGRVSAPKPPVSQRGEQAPVVTSSPQPSPTVSDETANWKIHENKDLGFLVKYPNNLYPDTCVATNEPVGSMFWDFQTDCAEMEIAGWVIGILIHNGYPDFWFKEGEDEFAITKKLGDVFVDGIKGEKFIRRGKGGKSERENDSGPGEDAIIITVLKMVNGKPKTYEFHADSDYEIVFNKMLTTFKFLP